MMRPRLRVAGGLLALAVLVPVPVSAGASGGAPADPVVIEQTPEGTCFIGNVELADCTRVEDYANDSGLANDAQMAQILAAGGINYENSCGTYYVADQIVTTLTAKQFNKRFQPVLNYGVMIVAHGDPTPHGFHAYRIAGGGHTAMSFVQALYVDQIVNDGPVAAGVVAPMYVLTGSPVSKGGPGSMPLPTSDRWKPSEVYTSGKSDLVIFDTVASKMDVSPQDGFNDAIAGHGDFVTGVAAAVYGGSIDLVDATSPAGVFTEATIALAVESYPFAGGEVANLSAGTYGCDSGVDGVDIEPMLLGNMVRELDVAGVHLVAAAGNDATDEPFYPAAYGVYPVPFDGTCARPDQRGLCPVDLSDVVTSVGSVESSTSIVTYTTPKPSEQSSFSNFGKWVEAWAVGEGIASDYPGGPYNYCVDSNGWCLAPGGTAVLPEEAPAAHLGTTVTWAGTSFATPQVAAWLAAGNQP